MRRLIAASLTLLFAAGLRAEEKKISEAEVPKSALEVVSKKYPTARKTGFAREIEHGKTLYEVQLVDGARKIDVGVSPEGRILAEEEELAFDAAPEAVKQAVAASKYARWAVRRVEKVIENENASAPRFELLVANGKDRAEIVFTADGKRVRTENKRPGNDND
jgi:hypothetical protein